MGIAALLTDFREYISTIRNYHRRLPSEDRLGSFFHYPVFVINLKRSQWRCEVMSRYLQRLGIKPILFPAIDGLQLTFDQLVEKGLYSEKVAREAFDRPLRLGEIACTLSHIEVSQAIVEQGIECAMVLEDDVTFTPGAIQNLKQLLKQLPEDWDLIQLFYRTDGYEQLTDNIVNFTLSPKFPIGSLGYLINASGAKKIVENGLPVRYPADSFFGRGHYWGMKVLGSYPKLVDINNIFPTEIHEQNSIAKKITYQAKHIMLRIINTVF